MHQYKTVKKDTEGYLKNAKDWNILLAKEIAKEEKIYLTKNHWKVINFVRKFYFQFNTTPSMRMILSSIQSEIGKKKAIVFTYLLFFQKGPLNKPAK